MKKNVFMVLILLLSILFLSGCDNNKIEEENKLSDVDNLAVNRILEMIDEENFNNPSEVRVLFGSVFFSEIVDKKYVNNPDHIKENVEYYYFKIQGTNQNGDVLNQCMKIYAKDTKITPDGIEIDLVSFGDRFVVVNDSACKENNIDKDNLNREIINVAKINAALEKYWVDLGIK